MSSSKKGGRSGSGGGAGGSGSGGGGGGSFSSTEGLKGFVRSTAMMKEDNVMAKIMTRLLEEDMDLKDIRNLLLESASDLERDITFVQQLYEMNLEAQQVILDLDKEPQTSASAVQPVAAAASAPEEVLSAKEPASTAPVRGIDDVKIEALEYIVPGPLSDSSASSSQN